MANPSLEDWQSAYAAWGRQDFDAAFAHWHEDAEWHPDVVGRLEGPDAYIGHEGLKQWTEAIADVFDRVETEVTDVRDLGERQIVLVAGAPWIGKRRGWSASRLSMPTPSPRPCSMAGGLVGRPWTPLRELQPHNGSHPPPIITGSDQSPRCRRPRANAGDACWGDAD